MMACYKMTSHLLHSSVWDSSIVVCKYLEKMGETLVRGKRCLDLSAGCGLVGGEEMPGSEW
jgi:predicted nicotinamide N-methyase